MLNTAYYPTRTIKALVELTYTTHTGPLEGTMLTSQLAFGVFTARITPLPPQDSDHMFAAAPQTMASSPYTFQSML